jgi:uncharacterized protein YgiM (DUF1202 family)
LLVYAEPNAAAQLLAVMSLGSSITVFPDQVQNGFTKVTIPDGRQGWAQLTVAGAPAGAPTTGTGSTTPASPTGIVVEARGNVRVRSEPSLNGTRLAFMAWGDQANLLARDVTGEWYQVDFGGLNGWVSAAWFVIVSGNPSSAPQTGTPSTTAVTTATTSTAAVSNTSQAGSLVQALGNVRLRNEPSLNGTRLATVPWGGVASLQGYDATGEWIKVDYNGLVGWSAAAWWSIGNAELTVTGGSASTASGANVTTTSSSPADQNLATVVVTNSPTGVIVQALGNIRLRDAASLNGDRVAGMAWGDQAAVLGRSADGEWLYLDFAGQLGWASAAWFQVLAGDITAVPVR